MSGKTTCKEVCSSCKTTIVEKQIKKDEKKDCVATIVGVLSLPESFCCQDNSRNQKSSDDCGNDKDDSKDNDYCEEKKDDCTEVYRDLGECLQKCIVKSSKNKAC